VDFPTTAGAFDTTLGGTDAFVTKLNPSGAVLLYSTYLGGARNDRGTGISRIRARQCSVGRVRRSRSPRVGRVRPGRHLRRGALVNLVVGRR
jgi:hypothetical protein